MGWLGSNPLVLGGGGTGAALNASNGGLVFSSGSALEILSGTSTAGQLAMSGSSTIGSWSTSTYPSTNAANTLLYASSANTMAALATANSGVLITSSGGVPSISSTLPSAVQGNITSTGALASGSIASGFTTISPSFGGTGVAQASSSSTLTMGGAVTFSGAYTFTGTLTGATSVTFPTSGTLASSVQGTWTPTVVGGSVAGTTTYVAQDGWYTTIGGNFVTVQCFVSLTAATGTGDIVVGGLPFTIKNQSNGYTTGAVYFYGGASWTFPAGRTSIAVLGLPDTTTANIISMGSGVTIANVQMANASNYIVFTMSYQY